MKRKCLVCSLILLISLLCISGYAEQGGFFDHTYFEKNDNYQYDKFDKTWTCYGATAGKVTSDINATFAIIINGKHNGPTQLLLRVDLDGNGITGLHRVESLQIMTDQDIMFDIPLPLHATGYTIGGIYLGKESGEKLCKAIAHCQSFSIRIVCYNGEKYYYDFEKGSDAFNPKYKTSFYGICKEILASGILDYATTLKESDSEYLSDNLQGFIIENEELIDALPETTATPKPTEKPTATPKTIPKMISHNDMDSLIKELFSIILKDPASLQINEWWYEEHDTYYYVIVDYSAKNGFGGANRDKLKIKLNYNLDYESVKQIQFYVEGIGTYSAFLSMGTWFIAH